MEIVRKKQIRNSMPIRITKKKFDGAWNPSQPENLASGSGKMAIKRQANGKINQAMEFLTEREFFFKKTRISIKVNAAARDISSCSLVIFFPS